MSQAHPDWWQIINLILIDHEERIAALESELIQDSGFPDSGYYDFPSVGVPYPERNDKRVLALELEVGRLREEIEYLRKFVHQYVNQTDLAEQVKELHKRIDHLENMIRHYIALHEGDHK